MSFWQALGGAAKAALQAFAATKGAPASVLPSAGKVVADIAGNKITFAQLVASTKALEGSSLGSQLKELVTNFGDVSNDLDVTAEVASALAPMLPIAGEVAIAVYVLKVGYEFARALPPSTWAPAPWPGPPLTQADWSHGFPKPQPVGNPSGAIGGG